MIQLFKYIPIAFLLLALPVHAERAMVRRPTTVPAKTVTTSVTASALSKVLEKAAQETLERFIPAREFEVTATAIPNNAKTFPNAPYEPKAVTSSTLQNLSLEELQPYIARVQIEVLLTRRLGNTRKKLEELLSKNLKLQKNRGDQVTFGALGIEIEDEAWIKQKNDLKQEMANLKSENDRLSRELQVTKTASATQKKENTKPEDSFFKDFWQENKLFILLGGGILIFAFLVVSVALLLMGRSMSNVGKNLGGAITAVASAMEGVGTSLSTPPPLPPGQQDSVARLDKSEPKLISESRVSGMGSLPIESVHSHLLKMRQELLDTLNESTEAIILRYLSQLCATPNLVGRAVVTMELLGRETSTQLFKRLSLHAQEAVLKFLREGAYDRPKTELMLEAGEELKTKLLAESFDKARGAASEKVAGRILQCTEANLVEAINELSPELVPRFFLYLDPSKIASVLAILKKTDPPKYESTVAALANMPAAQEAEDQDEAVLAALDEILDKTRADAKLPFLKIYQEIVEASSDDLKEEILKHLSSDPRLDNYLRENVITVNTFFLLNEEVRNELVDSLPNKEVAALLSGLKDEQKESILGNLTDRRRALINEEVDSLTAKGSRQTQAACKRAKEILIRKIYELKADGTLAKALTQSAPKEEAPKEEVASGDEEANANDGTQEDQGDEAA